MVRARILALVALAGLAPQSPGQQSAALEWRAQRQTFERGSSAWIEASFECFEAELEWDAHAASRTAGELVDATRESALPGARQAARAALALAQATVEGPARIPDQAEIRADPPPDEAPAWMRAHYHLALSRIACHQQELAVELADAHQGLLAARQSGDRQLHLRAAWITHHAADENNGHADDAFGRELAEVAGDPPPAAFRARLAMHEFSEHRASFTPAERMRRVDEIEVLARETGDTRVVGPVGWERAAVLADLDQLEGALAELERAEQVARAAGHIRSVANTLRQCVRLTLADGQTDRAAAYLVELEHLLDGRGMSAKDLEAAEFALEIALARRSADDVLAVTERLENARAIASKQQRAYARAREKLLGAERARQEFEEGMSAARAEWEAQLDAWGRAAALALGVVLAAGLVATHYSRRRLARANAQLLEQMERAETEARSRRALEDRMRRLERAESLGMVASGVAHDFNNLMVGVLGHSELLRPGEQDPARASQLDAIGAAAERAARLCQQLQAYAGDEQIEREEIDLAQLVRELEPVLRVAAGPAVKLDLDAGGTSLSVVGHSSRIDQALLNLVSNARDARARCVHVELSRTTLDVDSIASLRCHGDGGPGDYARVRVRDDGEGMNEALVERIFDPFFTTRFPGRGLGLAVVLGSMRMHGGLVAVESQPGAGTCFSLFFPLSSKSAAPQGGPAPLGRAARRRDVAAMEVLVVDDETDVREYVRTALAARGHRVSATGGDEGLERSFSQSTGPRRVALVDLSMPARDGRDVVRLLAESASGPAVVLMSGHSPAQLAEVARDLGVDGWVSKPFTVAQLENELAAAIEAHAAMTDAGTGVEASEPR